MTPRVVTCTRCDGFGRRLRIDPTEVFPNSISIEACPACHGEPELLAARRVADQQGERE